MKWSSTRISEMTRASAKGLVDKAVFAETHGLWGKACFDLQSGNMDSLPDTGSAAGDWDIHQAAPFARGAGFALMEDGNRAEFGFCACPAAL
jgi:hypothetical protein